MGKLARRQKHRKAQDQQRAEAGDGRQEKGYVFTKPDGEPLIPNTDYRRWKKQLSDAGVCDGRLHDAWHTAGTDRPTRSIAGSARAPPRSSLRARSAARAGWADGRSAGSR
jgi:hypothetical protein